VEGKFVYTEARRNGGHNKKRVQWLIKR